MTEPTTWRKASHSQAEPESSCVEVCFSAVQAAVRDSKNAGAGELEFSPGAWLAFLAGQR
ncbi:DUF397 domain-containing protein [Saccharothrix syringae]|uniref:DUF397 domain-containing protein n=1 Tax=Saccharothrix syringae TaxID=103733 RepID=A0A5Q0HEC0_SACSY|nr:DUF397 domain-containing protein [Saccharothrix syringae]QFZ24173.1 DUF397 domain-containing protein [Saccharothrix syringae]